MGPTPELHLESNDLSTGNDGAACHGSAESVHDEKTLFIGYLAADRCIADHDRITATDEECGDN
jgi:hypothetical protein